MKQQCFSSLKNQMKELLNFHRILRVSYKMETQKIINLLNDSMITLSTKENVNLTKQLSDGSKRSVYWNSYQTIPVKVITKGKTIYELLSVYFQDVKRLFVLLILLLQH